ncbi:MAG: PspC domain-containing protein [Chloroflexi bacterium]|nr:PspC domain-containing protein [Chloroflexota bacterium]MBP8060147.1 PspC domain-containing protein [Chloroflexota bacterium]
MKKRLMRSQDKMIFGVCAGLAEYMNVDPVVIRLLMVLLTLTTGYGLLIYLLLAILMPTADETPVAAKANPFDEEEIIIN